MTLKDKSTPWGFHTASGSPGDLTYPHLLDNHRTDRGWVCQRHTGGHCIGSMWGQKVTCGFYLRWRGQEMLARKGSSSKGVSRSVVSDCGPIDCSPPGSSVRGILQARILGWVATPCSRGSSWPRDWTQVSSIAGGFFTVWATGTFMVAQRGRAAHQIVLWIFTENKFFWGSTVTLLLSFIQVVLGIVALFRASLLLVNITRIAET